MATPYSQDLRDRVLRAYDRGMKTKQIALTFQVSPAWARRVKQRRRETGETTHRRMGSPGVTIVDRAQLTSLVRKLSFLKMLSSRQRTRRSTALRSTRRWQRRMSAGRGTSGRKRGAI